MLSSLVIRCSAKGLDGTLSRVVVAAQKLQDPLHRLALRVDGGQRAGAGQRGASEEALIQHLAAAEGAAGPVPGKAEQLDPVFRRDAVGGEVLLDLRLKGSLEI